MYENKVIMKAGRWLKGEKQDGAEGRVGAQVPGLVAGSKQVVIKIR